MALWAQGAGLRVSCSDFDFCSLERPGAQGGSLLVVHSGVDAVIASRTMYKLM